MVESKESEIDNFINELKDFWKYLLHDDFERKIARKKIQLILLKEFVLQNQDFLHFTKWLEECLDKKKRPITVYTYGQRVLRFLDEMYPQKFSDCSLSEFSSFFDNTCGTPDTVKNVRTALKLFDEFLKENNLPLPDINWRSKSLSAFEKYRERDILSESEFVKTRDWVKSNKNGEERLENLVLLTLLRRCGLRVSEVSRLRNIDVIGLSEPRLRVSYSKTRAGKKRMIPLFLLLDNEELEEVIKYFATKQDYIFVDAEKKRLKAAKIGNITQKLLTKAGIKSETAHGLRHALANALFAAFWIKINEENDCFDKEKWTNFCRPKIEGAAISHLYHIQLIMGHADLRVTFSTYIHLFAIAVFEIVRSSEKFQTLGNLKLNSAEK